MQTVCQKYVRLTLLVSSENPDLNVSKREDSDGLGDALLQLVLYSCGTQELDTQAVRQKHTHTQILVTSKKFKEGIKAIYRS